MLPVLDASQIPFFRDSASEAAFWEEHYLETFYSGERGLAEGELRFGDFEEALDALFP